MLNWLNPKAWIAAALKRTAIGLVNAEAASLSVQIAAAVQKDGPAAIDRTIDAAQARIIVAINTWGPSWDFIVPLRQKASAAVQSFGDDFQAKLDQEVKDHGAQAVDLAIQQAKTLLIARLNAINV